MARVIGIISGGRGGGCGVRAAAVARTARDDLVVTPSDGGGIGVTRHHDQSRLSIEAEIT